MIVTEPPSLGEMQIAELVHEFYRRVRQDPLIGPVFEAGIADWEPHLARMCDFWSSVMLTTGRYKGNPVAAHLRHPLRPEHFARWLALFAQTVRSLFAPPLAERFVLKSERIAESLKLALFYRPGAPAVPAGVAG